ncbi:MAG: HEAT repeat domain-containing protein [Elusimicrobia bacterium]|nr:HEAT repeat domain-containing protein [Elusimicrobiota bacterium]
MTSLGWIASSIASYYARTRNSAWTAASMLFLACALSYTRAQAGVIPDAAVVVSAKTMTPEELVRGLSDRDPGRRLAYRDETLARGAAAVPALVGEMRNRYHRERILQLIESIGDAAVPPLLGLLDDPVLGSQAGTALARTAKPASQTRIPDFLRCLKVENSRNACGTALAKAAKGAQAHLPAIVKTAKDGDPVVRTFACAAMGEVGGGGAVEPLMAALSDPVAIVRAAAAASLGRMGRTALPARVALKAAAKDADPDVRHEAGEALKRVRG